MGRGALQRQIHIKIEDVRYGVDQKQQKQREKTRSKQLRPAEQQHQARTVGKHHGRVGREKQGPLRSQDQQNDGSVAKLHQDSRRQEQYETPPGPVKLPAERTPGAQHKQK